MQITFDPTDPTQFEYVGQTVFGIRAADNEPAVSDVGFSADEDEELQTHEAGDGPDYDSKGYPWDERINTSNKGTRADGTWKRKPGIADDTYEAILKEIRPGSAEEETAAPPPPPATPAAPPAPPTAMSFQDFMTKVAGDGIGMDKVMAVLATHGLDIGTLATVDAETMLKVTADVFES